MISKLLSLALFIYLISSSCENCFATDDRADLSQQVAVIQRYERGIVKRSQTDIQRDIDQHTSWGGLGRQMGTQYERRTWSQWLIGRNEDSKIETLQSRGMEVSTKLSTGANILNLAKMVDQRDQAISELVTTATVLKIAVNAEHEILEEKERSFTAQQQLFEEVKREKDANIEGKNTVVRLMEEKERDSTARIISLIRLIDRNIEIPNLMTIRLGDAITVLDNLIRERLNY